MLPAAIGGSSLCGRQERPGGRARSVVAVAVAMAALLAGLLSPANSQAASEPAAAPDPADAAATLAYLRAGYQLEQSILRNAAASRSAAASVSEQLGHECPGVLSGAPDEEEGPPPSAATTPPRARGERKRTELQLQTIDEELRVAFEASAYKPDVAATESYAEQVSKLSWSNPTIAPLAQFEAAGSKEAVSPPTANVCADMKTWAQSGYHVLATASREFEAEQAARFQAVRPEGSLGVLLKPYERSTARALIRKTATLHVKVTKAFAGLSTTFSRLRRALGVPQSLFEARAQEPEAGHGSTDDGATFVVRSAPRAASSHACLAVSVTTERTSATSNSIGFGTSVCLSGDADRHPSTGCTNGIDSITAAVPASVRTVRLRLSNGRTITSKVVQVPRRDGGPGGVYVQDVRGYTTFPVSLTELNVSGGVVLVVKLRATRCRKESPTEGPTFVNLVSGLTPEGESFTIEGTVVHFGHDQTSFGVSVNLGAGPQDTGEGEIRQGKPKAYASSLAVQCQPHQAAIVYGILSAPGDSVLARTSEGLVPLTSVVLASDLHAEGPLVYGVFSKVPLELVVRNSDGSTVYSESLVARANEETEFCAGYTEA